MKTLHMAAWIGVTLVWTGLAALAEPTRVACVGDSITAGSGASSPLQSYPAQLGRMLGEGWTVENFGKSGATLLKEGDKPYWTLPQFRRALAFKPDIVVVQLGTNDAKATNWKSKARFAEDYREFLSQFLALDPKPRVFVCRPPVILGSNRYGIEEANLAEALSMMDGVARDLGLTEIDNHAATQGHGDLFPDKVHPNDQGAELLARTVYQALTEKPFVGEVPPPAPKPVDAAPSSLPGT